MSELVVVASERQVEVLAAQSTRAETWRRLSERLAAAFLQNTRFADAVTARAALATALPGRLEGAARVENGPAWERTLDGLEDALGALRARGIGPEALGRIEREHPVARVLRTAMNALEARLAQSGLVDERLRGARLGEALAAARPAEVARVVGARSVRARFVLAWEGALAAWWRPLSAALTQAGGGAVVELPVVRKPIDAARASDPFEIMVAETARLLDEAPVEVELASMLGDARLRDEVPSDVQARAAIRRVLDADAQARAAVAAVRAAADAGAPTDRMALGLLPGASKRTRAALVRHFREAGIPLQMVGTDEPSTLLEVAMGLLEAGAAGLARMDVAALVGASAVDPTDLSGVADRRRARAALRDLADALERTPAADGAEPLERLVATATGGDERSPRAALARRVGIALLGVAGVASRAEQARRARALFAAVGLAARPTGAVRGSLARDEARASMVTAALEAYARDARALDALTATLAAFERAGRALGGTESCSAATFVHELRRAVEARGARGAARAGAVRVVPLAALAAESLDLLVVLDANDGVLPARSLGAGVLTPALEDALGFTSPRARSLVELASATANAGRVVFCCRAADDDGAPLAPSPVVSWLERGGVPTETVHSAPLLGAPTTPHERDLALLALAPDRAHELAPHAAVVAARETARSAVHETGDGTGARLRIDETLLALLDAETGAGARPMSVTALERLARCPFQGFAAQVLGALDDDPRVADAPDRREEGILAHEALGVAFTAAAALWPARPRDRQAIERAALLAAGDVLARAGGALVRASLDRIHAEVARIVSLALDDDRWDFAFAERGFGASDDEWPALVIARDGARVALRGRIDRVDRSHDRGAVRAIDYKRRVSLPAIVELGATAIQVPLYALVARRALGASEARGRYLSTTSPTPASSAAFDERLAELVAEAPPGETEIERTAHALVARLRAGAIEPVPSSPKWCASCGLDGACRRPRFAVTALAEDESE